MMKKIVFYMFLMVAIIINANGFKEYEQNQKLTFKNYKQSLNDQLNIYKQVSMAEFNNYKSSIRKVWSDAPTTTRTRWIEYSKNYMNRNIVDFRNEIIRIEAVVDKGISKNSAKSLLANNFSKLIISDTNTAYSKDQFIQAVDKRLEKEIKNYDKSKVDNKPIVSDIYLGKTDTDVSINKTDIKKANQIAQKEINNNSIKQKPSKIPGKKIIFIDIKLPKDSVIKKAKTYKNDVFKYAKQNRIPAYLVFAIIQAESNFNPMARSHIPAFGLMQIVPRSAGLDATKKIYGKQKMLTASYLYNATNNIKVGSAYLNILNYSYLKKITDPTSRMYCVISAYNTGAGNVAKAFTGDRNVNNAAPKINRLSSNQVYNKLVKDLPYEETQNYLQYVVKRAGRFKTALENNKI